MTKIILTSWDPLIEEQLLLYDDSINFYSVDLTSLSESWENLLIKYWRIISQMYLNDWIFLNSLILLLAELNKNWSWVYWKRLHTQLVDRTKKFLKSNNCKILAYQPNDEIKEYLDVYAFEYELINKPAKLASRIKNIS